MSLNELFVIMIVGLIVIGPEKLPSLARNIGKASKKWIALKKALQQQINVAVEAESQLDENIKKALEAEQKISHQDKTVTPS